MTAVEPLVTILLATWNGAAFLPDQLRSIMAQTHQTWRLIVSDDGSTDETAGILAEFQKEAGHDRVQILAGPAQGATANFLSLLAQTKDSDGLIAFCDQDDIWLPEKLARAVAALSGRDSAVLYACALTLADASGKAFATTGAPQRPLGFNNALVENVLTGNTMVLSPAAADLARRALASLPAKAPVKEGFHDWFIYQVIVGSGGQVVFEPSPLLLYRQHAGNVVGSGRAPGRLAHRLTRVFGGNYGAAIRRQAEILMFCPSLLAENRKKTEDLLSLRDLWIWQRASAIKRIETYRQVISEDILLKLLLFFGRI